MLVNKEKCISDIQGGYFLKYINRKCDKVTEMHDVISVRCYRTLFSLPTVSQAGNYKDTCTYLLKGEILFILLTVI